MLSATLGDIVGEESASAFVRYLENLAKFSDADGTLREKLDRIFDDPTGARPLLKGKVEYSEIQEILALVECDIVDRGESLTLDQYINWTKYCVDVANYAKDAGVVAPHIKMSNSLNDTMYRYSMVMVSTVRIVQAKTALPPAEVTYITNKVSKYTQGTKWDVKSLGNVFSPFTTKFADLISQFKQL
jgi:hypothetical protein